MNEHLHAVSATGVTIGAGVLAALDPASIASLVSSLLSVIYWFRIWLKKPETPPPITPLPPLPGRPQDPPGQNKTN